MQIGKVLLDETFYSGKDLYSDGDVEDRMLAFARSVPADRIDELIARQKEWPILYHFSPLRENIVSWLPFTGQEKVLEIGAGCGAVTGALCRMAGQVTALDLSMKRSRINAWRHADADNLTILLGNFEDMEPSLDADYDYITLIGVFEYGMGYIHSAHPYEDFLKKVAAHLKPGGRIVLAIENRFGLKYWAGCTEDHTGRLFDGLEGYPAGSNVHTFTYKELADILEAAGGLHAAWYYPYPDYKLPLTIYSDSRLPQTGELTDTRYNFDRLRLSLFEESAVNDSILRNGLYPWFANSYLLLIGREEVRQDIVYSRFSTQRAPRFRVRTDILSAGEGRVVTKTPAMEEALGFVRELPEKTARFDGLCRELGLRANSCAADEDGRVTLEYLEGESLASILDALLAAGRADQALRTLLDWAERLGAACRKEPFIPCDEFRQIFGDVSLDEDAMGVRWCSIDFIPANILIGEESKTVLDTEWTFPFVIPAGFFVYRFIHYYVHSDSKRAVLLSEEPEKRAGLTEQELRCYEEMEACFQEWLAKDTTPLRLLYPEISPGLVDVRAVYEEACRRQDIPMVQVFFDRGAGFHEADSYSCPVRGGMALIPVPAGTHRLRLDPGEEPCCIRVREMKWDGKRRAGYRTNGIDVGEDSWCFGEDPQLILDQVPPQAASLRVLLERNDSVRAAQESVAILLKENTEQSRRIRQLEADLAARDEEISRMQQTKAWKLYRLIRPE